MNALKDIPLSMLDLVQIREGGTIADALAITLRTARRRRSSLRRSSRGRA